MRLVHNKEAEEKLGFLAKALFIPAFFLVTGFLIDPVASVRSLGDHFTLDVSIILALLVGKFLAAEIVRRAFSYSQGARMTTWSLTLPQVVASLAAALVGFNTFDPARHRLIDRVLKAVFVLMLTTSILGPVLTQRYAPSMLPSEAKRAA